MRDKGSKRGPKPKPEHLKQTKAILLKLTESDYELLKRAAGDDMLATWARGVLKRAAKSRLR